MNRILIAEDEPRIISFLEKGLRANGYTTTVVTSGPEATRSAQSDQFDLLILDLGLPGCDGLIVLEELRGRGETLPVIILTARDGIDDTVAGLDGGANDYLTKPFSFEELLARIRARLRDGRTPSSKAESHLQVGDLQLDLKARLAQSNGSAVELSAREFALVEIFLRHPGQVLTREQLLNRVWGYDYDPGSNIVDVYIGYLRKKLGNDRIETVRGVGYRLRGS